MRLAAACALAAVLHLAAPPLAAAAPRGLGAALRHESWIESVWVRVADAWKGFTATWANDEGDDGGAIDPWG